jgi:hypothetical protein
MLVLMTVFSPVHGKGAAASSQDELREHYITLPA